MGGAQPTSEVLANEFEEAMGITGQLMTKVFPEKILGTFCTTLTKALVILHFTSHFSQS